MADEANTTFSEPPLKTINTRRLRLRTLRVADAEAILPIISRSEVMQWTKRSAVANLAQAERWVKDRALGQDVFNFTVEFRYEPPGSRGEKPRVIGVVGSFHWPMIGYIIHPDYSGKGYATECVRALIPALFERMPSPCTPSPADSTVAAASGAGFDHIEAGVDTENIGSIRVLEKSGFTFCEKRENDFESPMLGLRNSYIYRIARPGKTLEGLGLLPSAVADEERPEPPIQ